MSAKLFHRLAARARAACALARDRGGATAVELAIVGPELLLFLLGIEETGRIMWTQAALNMAVEDAARCASVASTTTCATAGQVQAYASAHAWGMTIPNAEFTLSTPACGYQVAAAHNFDSVLQAYIPYAVTLTASACFPKWS
jgi:Flp pilus assembly protein TadG